MSQLPAQDELSEILSGLDLFADLDAPQLEAASHAFEEMWFNPGQRVIREGFTQPEFYLVLEGEASILIDGEIRATVRKGGYFGEISTLLGEPAIADVVAETPLRCLVLTAKELERTLQTSPKVMFRMLQAEARLLSDAIQWRT